MLIKGAEVFDPALSGDYTEPVRLEVMVNRIPEITYTEVNLGDYTVIHRGWLQSIFNDDWNDEDTRGCAAQFNSSMFTESKEPVFPVTVASINDDIWQDYYVKVTRVQRILNRLSREQGQAGYELLPDPIFAAKKMIGYQLTHPTRQCVRCVQRVAEEFDETSSRFEIALYGNIQRGCALHQVSPTRQVPLCIPHRIEWDETHRRKREKDMV